MKTFLVTGSNGLLGQKLVYSLLNRKDVTLIATSIGENRLIEKNGYTFESLDITDKSQVENIIAKHHPDVIINTAAMTNVDACETKREECWAINVLAINYFIESIANQELKNKNSKILFIHLSTDFIFDGEKGSEYLEADIPNPQSFYALSKFEGEKYIQQSSISWAIARTIIVYGVVDNMSRSNVVLWAKDALSKGQKINVVDDQFRSPTLAEDLAKGCIAIADKGAQGVFNISGKETMSVLELVYAVADFWKLDKTLVTPIKSNTLNQAAKRPPRTGFNIEKAKQELDYNPHSFMEGLKIVDEQLTRK